MTDPPQLQPYTFEGEKAVIRDLARKCSAIRIIEQLRRYKPRDAGFVIGLEMVQQRFQGVLDQYVQRAIADEARAEQVLREGTEWDQRWQGTLDGYLPVLRMARREGIRLVALNVDSEALAKVREVGLEGLSQEERGRYVSDPAGFIQSVKDPGFKLYAERFMMPSYAARAASAEAQAQAQAAGQTQAPTPTVSPAKFFAARILWDESMATGAARYLQDHPRDLMVLLMNAEHVKFGMGAPARLERVLQAMDVKTPRGRGQVKSILLNPTPEDTGSRTRRLRLSLGYAANLDKCRPVADYILYTESPKVAWLEHPLNPMSSPYQEDDKLFQVFPNKA